ncbi:MAG TPA: hypothetical protein VIX63_07830, partial [Vicinamibacterales bacterium]
MLACPSIKLNDPDVDAVREQSTRALVTSRSTLNPVPPGAFSRMFTLQHGVPAFRRAGGLLAVW